MSDLIEPHDPVPDCDCRNCACRQRDKLLYALERVLPFLTGNYWAGEIADPDVDYAIAVARETRRIVTPNVQGERR